MQVFPCFAFFYCQDINIQRRSLGFWIRLSLGFSRHLAGRYWHRQYNQSTFSDKLLANIAGAVVLAIFLFIVFSQ